MTGLVREKSRTDPALRNGILHAGQAAEDAVAQGRVAGFRQLGDQRIDGTFAVLLHRHAQRIAEQVGIGGGQVQTAIRIRLKRRLTLLEQGRTHFRHLEIERQ